MRITVVTIFPDMFKFITEFGIVKRAIDSGILDFEVVNLRDYTTDKHRTTDDYQYGGGPGMVMKIEPFYRLYDEIRQKGRKPFVILPTPRGEIFNDGMAQELSKREDIVFFCGRYEGIDERITKIVDSEISIGDYVLSCGELAAMVIIDATLRFVPGVLGNEKSVESESITSGLIDHPVYTRPYEFRGMKVPDVLLSGDHEKVEMYRLKESLKLTILKRPDLFMKKELGEKEKRALIQLVKELMKDAG